jgi:hypothetical protein
MNDSGPLRDYSRSRAVLLGAWGYTNLTPVPAAGHSLTRMKRLLIGPLCGWPADRVREIPDAPRRGNLPDELMGLFHDVTDVALFYFVGHGQLYGDELCLALTESPEHGPRRRTTGLPFADVREALYECDADTKIVILDCCFSGIATQRPNTLAATAAHADQVNVIEKASVTGAFTVAASGAYRTAWHEPDRGTGNPQTYFTKYLIDTIEQGLPDCPEALQLRVIFDRTADALAHDRLPEPTRSVRHNADRFVLAHNAALLSRTPPKQPAQPRLEQTPSPIAAEPQLPQARVGSQQLHMPAAPPGQPQTIVQPVVFRLGQNQRTNLVLWVIFWCIAFIVLGSSLSVSGITFPSQGSVRGAIIGGSVGLLATVVLTIMHLRGELVLTSQGIYLRRWKTKFIWWSEIRVVRVGRPPLLYVGTRYVRFVLQDRSVLSMVPIDVWGVRDREFDQKVWTIKQWHAQFGSPDPWWPGGRS